MTDDNKLEQVPTDDRWKRIIIYTAVLVVVFLLGLVPMWLISRSRANERDEARRDLRASTIQTALASAAIDARNGNYEPARQAASTFFTELRAEIDKGNEGAFNQTQQENLKSLLTPRDEVITLLARNDPAAADRLTDTFVAYRKALESGVEKH